MDKSCLEMAEQENREIKALANNKPFCPTFIYFSINILLTPHNFK